MSSPDLRGSATATSSGETLFFTDKDAFPELVRFLDSSGSVPADIRLADSGGGDRGCLIQVPHFSQGSAACAWIGDSAGCRARGQKLRPSEYWQSSAVVLRQNELRPGVGPSAAAGRHAWFGTNRNGVSFFPISEN